MASFGLWLQEAPDYVELHVFYFTLLHLKLEGWDCCFWPNREIFSHF